MFLSKPEKKAVVILLIVTALLALLFVATAYFIPDNGAVPYSKDLPTGSFVKLEGTVEDIRLTNTGGHLILSVSGVNVFVYKGGSDLNLMKGDRVKILGKTEIYSGAEEIYVDKLSYITIL